MSYLSNVPKCWANEMIIFCLALIFGTGSSIWSKTIMSMQVTTGIAGKGDEVEIEYFQKPLFLTLAMFLGMLFGLVMHLIVLVFRIPFPGYHIGEAHGVKAEAAYLVKDLAKIPGSTVKSINSSPKALSKWVYCLLAIPAVFDLIATALFMIGLKYLDASIHQMLRGSSIIFIALIKQHILKERLQLFHLVGIFWNVVSVIIIGATALFGSGVEGNGGRKGNVSLTESLFGVCLISTGALVQALQFVFEERVMKMDIPAPPLLLIGMEGLWGTLLSIFVMYPIGYWLPGRDHGSYEDPFNTWDMLISSRNIQLASMMYIFTIFFYNLFAALVTLLLSSMWRAILDNFRPITVWIVNLFIYYYVNSLFGEVWTKFSYIQILGMAVLIYGTAIYNAPNEGSILLTGQWYAFGIDCSDEYAPFIKSKRIQKTISSEKRSTNNSKLGSIYNSDPSTIPEIC